MRWGEFKKWVSDNHINDDDEILWIDFDEEPNEVHRVKDDGFYVS